VISRRSFIGTLAGGLLAAPLAAQTQPAGKVPRIGVLTNVAPIAPEVTRNWDAFRQGLGEHGWVEARNIVIEYRWSGGQLERLPALAAELVGLGVEVIVAVSVAATRAAKQASGAIPIVMVYGWAPVDEGLVTSLARPGGNVTGLTYVAGPGIVGKNLELLKEAVPKISRMAALSNPAAVSTTQQNFLKEAHATAHALTVRLQAVEARSPDALEGAFAAMTKERANALLVLPDAFTFTHAKRIADLATKTRRPAAFAFREAVLAGGLLAYAASAPDMHRRAASYVDKILKGAKPGDLPVEQPTKFELVINLKTAKALGLTIPQSLLQRADQVIE
jgi:putative ABC transport system substrate-binding protein